MHTSIFGGLHPTVTLTGPQFSPTINWAGVRTPEYAQLVAAANTAIHPTQQKQAYGQFNDYVLDQAFVMPYTSVPERAVVTTKVRDVRYNVNESLRLRDAWMTG
jgi:ABC-type transport system substrate-binding protein